MSSLAGIRSPWALLLAGPVIWSAHFLLVYLITEAVCGISGWEFMWFGVPGASVLVVVLTVLALVATAWFAVIGWRVWRGEENDESVGGFAGLGGLLLSLLFLVGVGFVGVPAVVLPPC